jgi:hypothetical protein
MKRTELKQKTAEEYKQEFYENIMSYARERFDDIDIDRVIDGIIDSERIKRLIEKDIREQVLNSVENYIFKKMKKTWETKGVVVDAYMAERVRKVMQGLGLQHIEDDVEEGE